MITKSALYVLAISFANFSIRVPTIYISQYIPPFMDIKVAVYVFVRKGIEFAVLKSAKTKCWSLPGGHLEFGESIADCARREVQEEIGLLIRNLNTISVTEHVQVVPGMHYIMFWVEAEYDSGELLLCEPDRCSEVRWVEEVPQPVFGPLSTFLEGKRLL